MEKIYNCVLLLLKLDRKSVSINWLMLSIKLFLIYIVIKNLKKKKSSHFYNKIVLTKMTCSVLSYKGTSLILKKMRRIGSCSPNFTLLSK